VSYNPIQVGSFRFVVETEHKGTLTRLLLSMYPDGQSDAAWKATLTESDSTVSEPLDSDVVRKIELFNGNQVRVELLTDGSVESVWFWLETGKAIKSQWNE
jgi:hypothetical protein